MVNATVITGVKISLVSRYQVIVSMTSENPVKDTKKTKTLKEVMLELTAQHCTTKTHQHKLYVSFHEPPWLLTSVLPGTSNDLLI